MNLIEPDVPAGVAAVTFQKARRARESGETVTIYTRHPERWEKLAPAISVDVRGFNVESEIPVGARARRPARSVSDAELDDAAERLAATLERLVDALEVAEGRRSLLSALRRDFRRRQSRTE